MVEPGPSTSQNQFDEQSNVVMYPEAVDSLSTNQCNEQMDEESERTNEEERTSTPASEMGLELNEELEAGYKILTDLMSHSKRAANWPFMEAVEVSAPELAVAYNNKIEKPVWLKMMKQKFEEHQYTTITAFVSDFRLMLENCYRFNGPDHYISKRAQKMETMLEQKLALLPRDIRDKTTIAATTEKKSDGNSGFRRRPKSHILHDSTYLLNQLREAEYQKKREYRIRQIMARRAEREALAQEIMEWEENVLFGGKKHQMKAMWEIPQIGLFLFLCQGPLNIGEIMHFELERCFMMPRESSTMQLIMTSLLSTPFQRLKLDRRNLMPYNVWEQKLRAKFETWYKAFSDSNNDVEKTCLKFGIDDQFFDIVGHKNPLERKRYHELSFYKKVWIMKSLCDHCLHQQDSLRETIEVQPFEDQREYLLGTDNAGQRYIHFPQFCGADVRIYRQAAVKYPKIEIKPDPFDNKRKFPFVYKPPPLKKQKLKKKKRHRPSPSKPSPSEDTTPTSSPQRQRPSRLRQAPKSVVPLQLLDETSVTEESHSSASDSEDNDASSAAELPEPVAGGSKDLSASDTEQDTEEFKSADRESTGSDATLPYGDNSDSNSNLSSRDCSRNSSPYPTYSDLSVRFSSHMDQSSDISQESSPCPSPADYVRRSSRLERFSDTSRDASPLIFDADFGLRRSSRNRARLKNIPPLRATRNLSNFLVDENSVSNSSLAGENSNSLSELGPSLFGGRLTSRKSSKSSDTNDDSYDCDMHVSKLFTNSKTSDYGADVNRTFHEVLKDTSEKTPDENDSMSSVNDMPACRTVIDDESLNENEPGVSKNNTDIKNYSPKRLENHEDRVKVSDMSQAEEDEGINNTAKDRADENLADCENLYSFKNADKNVENKDSKDIDGCNKMVNENLIKMDEETEVVDTLKDNDDAHNGTDIPEEFISYSEKQLEFNKEFIQDHDTKDAKENIKIEQTENNEIETIAENLSSNDVESGFENSHDSKSKQEIGSDTKNIGNFQIQTVKKEKDETLQNLNDENSEDNYVYCNSNEKENCDKVKEANNKINLEIKDSAYGDSKITIKQETFVDAEIEPSMKEKSEDLEDNCTNKKPKTEPKEEHYTKDKIELKEENEAKDETDEEEEMEPDAREFEMMADCVEDIRKLAEQFAEPEPVVCRRGKKEQVQKPPRKKNIVILHERLQFLLKELEPWETKLQQATKRARLRLRKEMEDYVEEEDDGWKSNNEESESVESESDQSDDGKDQKTTAKTTDGKMSVDSSRCSTPVKPPEDVEEIDISHRGRLRKRRIIPNNVEDQLGSKKPKPSQPQTQSQTQTEPVIVQSGKTQLVEYADIIRQLQSSGGNMPILIKTTKGGRTVLTSVMPVNAGSKGSNCVATETLGAESVRMVSSTTVSQQSGKGQLQPQAVRISVPGTMGVPATSKALQHPTIQNLLSGTVAGTRLLQKTAAASAATTTTAPTSLSQDGTSMIQPTVILPPTPEKTQAVKVVLANQTAPQKVVPSPLTTPRKIAPHTSASESGEKAKAKYYAANAGTLPINVVQQLISSRGAKLTQGACNQSILLIPMESDGQGKTAVSSSSIVTTVKTDVSPSLATAEEKIVKTENVTTAVKISGTPVEKIPKTESTITTVPITLPEKVAKPEATMTTVKTSPNTPILPKPQISPVLGVSQGLSMIQIQQPHHRLQLPQAYLESNIVDGKLVTKLVQVGLMLPKSPSRYPTNETVKTLLEKRKPPMEEKEPFILEKKPLNVVNETKHTVPKPHVKANQLNSAKKVILPLKSEENSKMLQPGNNLVQSTATVISTTGLLEDRVKTEATNAILKAQQCVIASISAAKLNTLLLQTSAAGAKTIPSMIKLPSKAALDSAVKAVVTSVNTTLPTVNIKVPSPTSLPSIGPRRNVTKTIQTMKSPIPVAPKVVTQSSGRQTMLSVADSKTVSSQVSSVSPILGAPSVVSLTSAKNVTGSLDSGFVTQSQTGVPDQNGKNVVTRLTPQLVLTSKGVMQLGFVNSDAVMVQKNQLTGAALAVSPTVASAATQPGNQAMWIQNNSGQYQLIQQTSPVLQQSLAGANQQQMMTSSVVTQGQGQILFAKPVVAVGPRGNPVILPPGKASIQTTLGTSPPSIVLHNSTYYATATPIKSQPHPGIMTTGNDTQLAGTLASSTGLKSPGATGSFQYQMGTNLVQVPQSPILSQAAMVSPVLGLQQGLVLQGGVQVASPLISPMGINLLQPGLQIAQNPAAVQGAAQTLVQKAGTVAGVPQLLTINPLLLNTALTSGGVVSQQPVSIPKMSVTLKSPSTTTDNTQVAKAGSAVPKMMATWSVKYPPSSVSVNSNQQMPTAQILTSSGDKGPISSASYQQLKHQLANLVIPAAGGAQQLNMLGQLAATPGSAQRCLNFQYPSSDSLKTARLVSPQNTIKTEPEHNTCSTTADSESVLNMPVSINQVNLGSRTSPSQQKLLLFSIGGQLVTGQGVPVSLSDGVLKVVPNGKIKVNNQILTTEQIKQTLAKINEAAAVTLNPANQQQLQNQQTTSGFNSEKVTHVKIVKDGEAANRPTAKITNRQTTSGIMQENVTHVKIVKDGGMANKSVDHTYLNTSVGKEKVVTKLLNGSSRLEGGLLTSIKTEVDDSSANENVSPNFSDSYHVMNSDMKIEPKEEIEFLNQSEKQFVMKPMLYSSGYVFQPKTSNSADNNIEPGKKSKNFDIGKLIVDKEAKRFFIKAPVKSDLSSGEGDASNSLQNNHNVVLKVKTEGQTRDDDDENENKLVIDDGVSEKEAALNLLTFANQAMMPLDTMGAKSDSS